MQTFEIYTVDEVITFLEEVTGTEKIAPETDLYKDIGVVGDDFHEMMQILLRDIQ